MQKKFGFAPLGAAEGPVKTAIFGDNNARLYNVQPKRAMLDVKGDRFAAMKAEYEKWGQVVHDRRRLLLLQSYFRFLQFFARPVEILTRCLLGERLLRQCLNLGARLLELLAALGC